MIVKDTPRNLEFLKGNSKGLTPMTHEEAVLAGTAEPRNVNEAYVKEFIGGGSLKLRQVSIGLASTSVVGAKLIVPVCDGAFMNDTTIIEGSNITLPTQCVYDTTSVDDFGEAYPVLTIRIEGGVYDSVSGSGFTMEENDTNYVSVAIKSDDAVVRVKVKSDK